MATLLAVLGLCTTYFFCLWCLYLINYSGFYLFPAPKKMATVINIGKLSFRRSHISHMRIDRIRRPPGYSDWRLVSVSFGRLALLSLWLLQLLALFRVSPGLPPGIYAPSIQASSVTGYSMRIESGLTFSDSGTEEIESMIPDVDPPPLLSEDLLIYDGPVLQLHGGHSSDSADDSSGSESDDLDSDAAACLSSDVSREFCVSYGPALRLRGGHSSDSDSASSGSDSNESDSDMVGLSIKRKRKSARPTKPHKRNNKGKGKARDASDSETGLRITVGGKKGSKGMFVDEVRDITEAVETWDISPSHRVAFILDVTDTPECLQDRKPMTVDAYIKKQCQDAWTGPTGSRTKGLAKVTILDEDREVECRRSNLKCNGFFTCSLASPDHLLGFERWNSDSDSATQELISAPNRAAKNAEATDIVAIAIGFYRSVMNQHCKAKGDRDFECGGHAAMRKHRTGRSNGKNHFIGCSNWFDNDGSDHRFTRIPVQVRESILLSLFKGEEIVVEDNEMVEGHCSQIVHPSHLPRNKECPRVHYRDKKAVTGRLEAQMCPAELLILIPADANDLRAVVIPKLQAQHRFWKGNFPKKFTRACREMVQSVRETRFPEGTGMNAVLRKFEKDKSREIGDRYIHAVTMQADMDIIITLNPELAELVHDASWIMVDTTFAVVHGTTNEWKLLIWLNGIDKRELYIPVGLLVESEFTCQGTVIGRVWSNRATRDAFVIVWNGIFEAIKSITGLSLNFKVFSKKFSLLGVIGDSEGAQAQGLGDVIILRQMNTPEVNGFPTVTVDAILLVIWKTCLVHFKRTLLCYLLDELMAYEEGFSDIMMDDRVHRSL
ncbi:hypothetical protein B0H11DRAFT_1911874 [Mycena galericulata]|nr:hypothetical protein B0H11DRAFT_1911874 [Mycena galericulata]